MGEGVRMIMEKQPGFADAETRLLKVKYLQG